MKFNENRNEVELHIHIDGAFRPSTVFQIAKKKGMQLPVLNEQEFEDFLRVTKPDSLCSFLQKFHYLLSPIAGDKEALTQVIHDFVEDCVNKGGHCYVEPRFSPHCLTGDKISPHEATKTVIDALNKYGHQYDLQWRAILCMIRDKPEWSNEVTDLAHEFRSAGVVAVDVAGDDKPCDGCNTAPEIKAAFKRAMEMGIHRTVHAGENGCVGSVTEAVHEMHAERIGHGYHILDDPAVYQDMRNRNIHFECCPLSSQLTGSVVEGWNHHPLVRFEQDGVNYSISTDDPTVTGQWLKKEKRMLAMNQLLDGDQFQAANIRAAKAAFLEEAEREELVRHLEEHPIF